MYATNGQTGFLYNPVKDTQKCKSPNSPKIFEFLKFDFMFYFNSVAYPGDFQEGFVVGPEKKNGHGSLVTGREQLPHPQQLTDELGKLAVAALTCSVLFSFGVLCLKSQEQ